MSSIVSRLLSRSNLSKTTSWTGMTEKHSSKTPSSSPSFKQFRQFLDLYKCNGNLCHLFSFFVHFFVDVTSENLRRLNRHLINCKPLPPINVEFWSLRGHFTKFANEKLFTDLSFIVNDITL